MTLYPEDKHAFNEATEKGGVYMKIVRTACAVIALHDVLCIGTGLLTTVFSEDEQEVIYKKLKGVVKNPNQPTWMWAINQLEYAELVFGHNLGIRLFKK